MAGGTSAPELSDMITASGCQELEFWNDVINTMSEALMVISPDRRIVYCNEQARALLRVPIDKATNLSCLEAIDCPQCSCQCRLFESGLVDNVKVTINTPEPRIYRKNGRLLTDRRGRVIGGIETFADITSEVHERSERVRSESRLHRERVRSSALLKDLNKVNPGRVAVTLTTKDIEQAYGFCGIISRNAQMHELFRLVESVADSRVNVLIEGASGTGKELVARAIHQLGDDRERPYYAVNCATFTGSLLLSELFGHERGSFTGAFRTQRGKLELAERGTLLLDEVGEIPIEHQALLLRVLECRKFERLGGTESIPFRARVLSATNRSLIDAINERTFRRDLYFRLNVVPIAIPPLCERAEDIELLLHYFLLKQCGDSPEERMIVSPEVIDLLNVYPWPGNVRELRNLVEFFSFTCGSEVRREHVPRHITHRSESTQTPAAAPACDERARILDALQRAHFRRNKAAQLLGIDRTTLWRKMKRLGLSGA